MRLTRNTTSDGRGKYALVRLDKLRALPQQSLLVERSAKALDELATLGFLEYGEKGSAEEAFTIKLKDKNAAAALDSYAEEARLNGDFQLAADVLELAQKSENFPTRKMPD